MTGELSPICQNSTYTKDNHIVPSQIMLRIYERMHIFSTIVSIHWQSKNFLWHYRSHTKSKD